ncbi:hypothetical protein FS834_17955 [Agrobacterium vitis]|uniref:hypothetical protein n=1 Tax=Allorhizobium ampelinum TaxID=3025782 RepID=UPI001F1CC10F|nr:hypothetical protein [Allorhizobium ampelinum]MCF1494388.1 hypothetical protein [Allorhizobium ampelinum]
MEGALTVGQAAGQEVNSVMLVAGEGIPPSKFGEIAGKATSSPFIIRVTADQDYAIYELIIEILMASLHIR